jgi:NADPH:quinone reductase-like Zn-dependent oxidoreductase
LKAVGFRQHGDIGELELMELGRPHAEPGEALIRVKAVALNHVDLFKLRGIPGQETTLPHVGGADVAGVVAGLGEGVGDFDVGQRVVVDPTLSCGECEWCQQGEESLCAEFGLLGEHAPGGLAEYVVVPTRNLLLMPDDFSFVRAAAVPLVFATAWRALVTRAHVRPGEHVLILGASGGVATAAIQIAKLAGARVYAVTSSPAKLKQAQAIGADWTVDRTAENWSKAAYLATDKRGMDVVVENVGAATWFDSLRSATRGGRIVTFGATSGPRPETDIRYIFWKQLTILGSTMASRHEFRTVMSLVWDGTLQPVIDSVYRLEETPDAYRRLASGEQFGKVVVNVAAEGE